MPSRRLFAVLLATCGAAVIAADALNPWEPAIPRQDFALICYNCEPGTPPPEIFADGFEEELPPALGH